MSDARAGGASESFLPQEVIRAKRDGRPLPARDIKAFVAGLVDGRVGKGQAAAFAVAMLPRGLPLRSAFGDAT